METEKDQRTTKNGKSIFIKLLTQFEARNYLKLTTQIKFFLIKREKQEQLKVRKLLSWILVH